MGRNLQSSIKVSEGQSRTIVAPLQITGNSRQAGKSNFRDSSFNSHTSEIRPSEIHHSSKIKTANSS
ncbi:MAG: hypothetical protein J0L60_15780 [Ignavibacteria bacterium]|nr:hypothetical protein [Ignavibacteria bacterium]